MSGTLNKVMLIGHLGDDVKMHYFDGGGSIGRFPLATNESYVNKSTGEKVTNTEWHNIVINVKGLVDVAHKYLKKGHKVYLEGRIKTKKWQDQSGNDRYSTEIQVNQMTMLTSRAESEGLANDAHGNYANTEPANSISSPPQPKSAEVTGDNSQETDDLPF